METGILFSQKNFQEKLQHISLSTWHTQVIDDQKGKKISPGADDRVERKINIKKYQLWEPCQPLEGSTG
jgi:hypothetical protein